MKAETAAQVLQAQSFARLSPGRRRQSSAPALSLPHANRVCANTAIGTPSPSQVSFPQRLTQSSPGRPHTSSRPLPRQRRCQTQSPGHVGRLGIARKESTHADVRRNEASSNSGVWLAVREGSRPPSGSLATGQEHHAFLPRSQQLRPVFRGRLAQNLLEDAVEVRQRLEPDLEGNLAHAQIGVEQQVLGFLDAHA